MWHIKAGQRLNPLETDGRARLLFTSGFYSNQVFSMCVNTKNQACVLTVYLQNQACVQNRFLYETGFYTRHYRIQYEMVMLLDVLVDSVLLLLLLVMVLLVMVLLVMVQAFVGCPVSE